MRDRIEMILAAKGLNSSKFAELLGIQKSSVSHFLNGRNNPSLEVVLKILNTFPDLNIEWLVLGVGEMYKKEGIHSVTPQSLFTNVNTFVNNEDTQIDNDEHEILQNIEVTKVNTLQPETEQHSDKTETKSVTEITEQTELQKSVTSDIEIKQEENTLPEQKNQIKSAPDVEIKTTTQTDEKEQVIISSSNPPTNNQPPVNQSDYQHPTLTERILILNSDRTFTEYFPRK